MFCDYGDQESLFAWQTGYGAFSVSRSNGLGSSNLYRNAGFASPANELFKKSSLISWSKQWDRFKSTEMSASEQRVYSDLALMLAMIPGLSRWSKEEKSAIEQIVQAKAGTDELRYALCETAATPSETARWFADDWLSRPERVFSSEQTR